MFKSGYAVIVGRPNVGKSTLMNHLIGQKIAITSNRPQTTRGRIETVFTNERGQIIFLDTPGMIRKADNKLGEYLIDVSNKTIGDADVVLWLIEPSSYIGKGDQMIAEKLTKSGKPVILIINKIDTIDKKKAAEIIEAWKGVCRFKDIIAVSALRSVNMDEVINSIMRELPEGPLYYDEETVKKWLQTFCRRFFNQQFKRSCLPDGPKVGSVSLSPRGDWRMPSDASSALWLKECDTLE